MVPSVRALVRNAVFDRVPYLLRRGPSTARRVALTFDDGPDHLTTKYLDLMDELGVPGTFFLLGEYADRHPELVREYMRRGHQIASHGYDHQRFTKLGYNALRDQCARTEKSLGGQITGRPWVRPPHGSLHTASVFTLLASGYTVALWTLDSCDYGDKDPAVLVERCSASKCAPGEVLLFHEGQQWTLDALPAIVRSLHDAGYECVTMHDLFMS